MKKWDGITMDFVTKLPWVSRAYDSIWVVVDQLTKSVKFIHIHENYLVEKLVGVYISEK